MITTRLLKLDKEARESDETMLWSKAAHKCREIIKALQQLQDEILQDTGSTEIRVLEQKAAFILSS